LTGRKDRTWLRLGLASSNARHGREPLRRAPERRQESGLQAEAVASPPVSEDDGPVEASEFSVEELSLISSGEKAEEGSQEGAVRDDGAVDDDERSSGIKGRGRRSSVPSQGSRVPVDGA
jgi:hypothetical protein